MEKSPQLKASVLQPEQRRRCQAMTLNLLRNKEVSAPFYIREWDQMKRCDEFHDTADVRGAFSEFIGDEALARLRAYDMSVDKDEMIAAQAVYHYADFCDRRLYQSLDWKNKAVYQTFDRASHLASTIGLMTMGYGAVKGMSASVRAVAATVRAAAERRAAKKAAEEVAAAAGRAFSSPRSPSPATKERGNDDDSCVMLLSEQVDPGSEPSIC